jgi:hypothetical protein
MFIESNSAELGMLVVVIFGAEESSTSLVDSKLEDLVFLWFVLSAGVLILADSIMAVSAVPLAGLFTNSWCTADLVLYLLGDGEQVTVIMLALFFGVSENDTEFIFLIATLGSISNNSFLHSFPAVPSKNDGRPSFDCSNIGNPSMTLCNVSELVVFASQSRMIGTSS